MDANKVWLITGCSRGIGRSLAETVLKNGGKVAVTARNTDDIQELINQYPKTAINLKLDVTRPDTITKAVSTTKSQFGRIDILVNNAAYGSFGTIEETPDIELRRIFDTNFFGVVNVIREVLPIMREQGSGHIINMSAAGGLVATACLGPFAATKFALEGMTEALADELEPLGIQVTLVEPGPTRTTFLNTMLKFEGISDYNSSHEELGTILEQYKGNQPSDPAKISAAITEIAGIPGAPLRLVLGKFALERIREKLTDLNETMNAWEATSEKVDFD